LGWGSGIDLSLWGGSGWRPDWFGGTVFVDNFFHRHGFHHDRDHGDNRERWAHDPGHRRDVPYPNRNLRDVIRRLRPFRERIRADWAPTTLQTCLTAETNALQGGRTIGQT